MARKKSIQNTILIADRKWYKNLIALGAIFTVFVGIWTFFEPLMTPDPIEMNYIILVDTSNGANERFDGTTKAMAVEKALRTTLSKISNSDNTALRQFGGECENTSKATSVLVDFATDNKNNILSALKKIDYFGARTLNTGIIEATGAFNNTRRFGNVKKRIVVITSGEDTCEMDDSDLIERLEQMNIRTGFLIIGVGVPPKSQQRLKNIVNVYHGRVKFAESRNLT